MYWRLKATENAGVTVDAKDVGDFNFVPSTTTGIENIEMNPNVAFGSKISGLTPGSKVIVATADGKVILSQNVSDNGKAEVELHPVACWYYSSSRLRKALLKSRTNFLKKERL